MSTQKDGAPRGAAKAIIHDSTRPPAKWRRTLRALIEVAGHRGELARIAEYRLDDENRARAREMLARDATRGSA